MQYTCLTYIDNVHVNGKPRVEDFLLNKYILQLKLLEENGVIPALKI